MKRLDIQYRDWSEFRLDILRAEWAKGTTASRIAQILGGTTRNAVIGKASRLGLIGRTSPINRGGRPFGSNKVKLTPPNEISPGVSAWQQKFWTPERESILRKGYNAATMMSVGQIGLRVGCSGASVIRWATHLGLTHPHSSHSSRKAAREKGVVPMRKIPKSVPLAKQAPAAAPNSGGVTLADLGARRCLFPTSPHMAPAHAHLFCGAPIDPPGEGMPVPVYCGYHHAIATRAMVTPEDREADNNAARMAAE